MVLSSKSCPWLWNMVLSKVVFDVPGEGLLCTGCFFLARMMRAASNASRMSIIFQSMPANVLVRAPVGVFWGFCVFSGIVNDCS